MLGAFSKNNFTKTKISRDPFASNGRGVHKDYENEFVNGIDQWQGRLTKEKHATIVDVFLILCDRWGSKMVLGCPLHMASCYQKCAFLYVCAEVCGGQSQVEGNAFKSRLLSKWVAKSQEAN